MASFCRVDSLAGRLPSMLSALEEHDFLFQLHLNDMPQDDSNEVCVGFFVGEGMIDESGRNVDTEASSIKVTVNQSNSPGSTAVIIVNVM